MFYLSLPVSLYSSFFSNLSCYARKVFLNVSCASAILWSSPSFQPCLLSFSSRCTVPFSCSTLYISSISLSQSSSSSLLLISSSLFSSYTSMSALSLRSVSILNNSLSFHYVFCSFDVQIIFFHISSAFTIIFINCYCSRAHSSFSLSFRCSVLSFLCNKWFLVIVCVPTVLILCSRRYYCFLG